MYIGVLMCMHMSAYVCGGADLAWMMGFGIMVVSGCRTYVTEPVDVVLVVTGRVHVCTVLWCWYVLLASSMIVLMVVVEYTTRVVTLLWMCIILCGVDVIIFNAIERYVSCVMVVRVGPRSMAVDGCMLVPVCIV